MLRPATARILSSRGASGIGGRTAVVSPLRAARPVPTAAPARRTPCPAPPPPTAPAAGAIPGCTASSEWPPSSKKLSWRLTRAPHAAAPARSRPVLLLLHPAALRIRRGVCVVRRRGQCAPVQLAVRRQRPRVQPHVRRRHHVARQVLRGLRSQCRDIGVARVVRDEGVSRLSSPSRLHSGPRFDPCPLPNHAQARPPRALPSPSPAAPRSPPTRSGIRVSSPGSRFAPDIPGSRPCANAPDPPSYTAAHPSRTDRR
ncbi:hypothetical protein DU27_5688 [Burkholderia pseudomallei]|nr:hypothetical protein DU27_5688 [Burkholderia pseudomallei]